MILGWTPTLEAQTNLPRIGRPSLTARFRRTRRTAAAPSEI
jgi:hypothetical protein